MPESLPPELIELRDTCAKLAATMLELANAEPASARATVREAAKDAGLFAMTQPTAFGGTEASQLALTVARETLAAHNPPYMEAVFGPSPGVLGGVDEPLRSSHLAPLLAGEKRSSFGFTEPDNVESPTSGVIQGETLTINGQKSYVTGGADADFVNALVHIDGRGPSMVVIDTDREGVILDQKFSSLDGSHHAAFLFRDVEVPTTHIIGESGQGLPRAMRQIGDTRLLFAAQASGYMMWVLDLLTNHLKSPDRSGEPRGNKDVVRWHYANLRIKAFAARSMLYRTARIADSGENAVNEAMATKAFATEAVGEVIDTAIQLVGGTALVETHPLVTLYKRVRAWRLAEGASDILRLNIGRGILELDKGRI
jgi:alkylation response protein AidB-like acyl-CoA dehydrogenase